MNRWKSVGVGAGRLALGAAAGFVCLVLTEVALRLLLPGSGMGAARELTQFGASREAAELFVLDPSFGFRPALDGRLYSEWGTLTNGYGLGRTTGRRRLLFAGDSVMARGRLLSALRQAYGEDAFEYWNAGVESFNTVQEVQWYLQYGRRTRPDDVILAFHLNDFETTPVAFSTGDGRLIVYAPNFPARAMNPTLFRWSMLYRFYLAQRYRGAGPIDAVIADTEQSLRELQSATREDGTRLTVLVLPLCKPPEEWTAGDHLARSQILGMLRSMDIRHIDLAAPLLDAVRAGEALAEAPGDDWHPGDALCARFAAHLKHAGLLDNP